MFIIKLTPPRSFRSTKGASKARRDLINAEIQKLRALLPISAEERERLSYLHAMSVICTFIRKSVLLARKTFRLIYSNNNNNNNRDSPFEHSDHPCTWAS